MGATRLRYESAILDECTLAPVRPGGVRGAAGGGARTAWWRYTGARGIEGLVRACKFMRMFTMQWWLGDQLERGCA